MPRIACAALGLAVSLAVAAERTEHFDTDPGWDGQNNRSTHFEPRTIVNDFGWSRSQHAGGAAPGELGGRITPAAEPAYYAKPLPALDFDRRLSASGALACGDEPFHVLIGFFNARTLNDWRTPNTVVLRLQGRGGYFYAFAEYATSRWRAGGTPQFARDGKPVEFAGGLTRHTWTLSYDPAACEGAGAIVAGLDGQTFECRLEPGHRADGATFDHFGILTVMKSADSGGEVWLDDLAINGVRERFDDDPGWDGLHNRETYVTTNIRPRFDFGFSPTNLAGGGAPGELGGLVFRGDCREAARMAHYGDRVGPLGLAAPLRAAGRLAMHRGVSDSTTLFGFYHHARSLRANPAQDIGWPECFVGFAIEGPSSEGFFAYPVWRTLGEHRGNGLRRDGPRVYPNGAPHDWALNWDPAGDGTLTLTFDGQALGISIPPEARSPEATLDRFGLVTTWVDGNGQTVFFDDLVYTSRQEP